MSKKPPPTPINPVRTPDAQAGKQASHRMALLFPPGPAIGFCPSEHVQRHHQHQNRKNDHQDPAGNQIGQVGPTGCSGDACQRKHRDGLEVNFAHAKPLDRSHQGRRADHKQTQPHRFLRCHSGQIDEHWQRNDTAARAREAQRQANQGGSDKGEGVHGRLSF